MRNTHLFKLRLLAMLGVAVFFLGCKDEEGILGLDVQPGSDKPTIAMVDTFKVISYTTLEDSLRSDEAFSALLGTYNDPVFGETKTSIYTQLLLEGSNIDFGTNPVLDSVILSLDYDGIYGDSTASQTVLIHELLSPIEKTEEYYSNYSASINASPIGRQKLALLASDSITIDTVTYRPHLRIKLDSLFGQELMNNIEESTTQETFLEILHGLYITIEDSNLSPQSGAIGKYNLGRPNNISGLSLFYHNDSDTSSLKLSISQSNTATINQFKHDYSQSPGITGIIADSTFGQDEFYVQGASGLRGTIEFPSIENLKDSAISVNQALLYLPVATGTTELYEAPKSLNLALLDSTGKKLNVSDYLFNPSRFDGNLSEDGSFYRFNITRHINSVISGEIENFPLLVLVSGGVINPNRLILSGANGVTDNLRLQLTYTKP